MRTITNEELKDILEKHKTWLNGKENGERADLSETNNIPFIPIACSEKNGNNDNTIIDIIIELIAGEFIEIKKALHVIDDDNNCENDKGGMI